MRTVVAARVLAAALAGCSGDMTGADAREPSPAPTPRELGSVGGGSSQDFSIYYRTFEDFVTQSSMVFEGEVVDEARGAATTRGELREQPGILQIEVREVLSGVRPDTDVLRVEDFGWWQAEGRPEQVHRPGGHLRVEVGEAESLSAEELRARIRQTAARVGRT